MERCSERIKDMLVAAGEGTFAATTGWGIYIGEEPATPDTTITVYDTPGGQPEYFSDDSLKPIERPGIQIRVRALSYAVGVAKILSCMDNVRSVNTDVTGVRYLLIREQNSWLYLGKDEKERFLFVQNLLVQRREISS